MISVQTNLTGPQIARALAEDVEEAAYALAELADELSPDYFWEVADHIQEPKKVAGFPRDLAEAIDPLQKGPIQ